MDQVNSVSRDILSALNMDQVNSVPRDILSALNMDQVNSVPRDILSALNIPRDILPGTKHRTRSQCYHVIYYLH